MSFLTIFISSLLLVVAVIAQTSITPAAVPTSFEEATPTLMSSSSPTVASLIFTNNFTVPAATGSALSNYTFTFSMSLSDSVMTAASSITTPSVGFLGTNKPLPPHATTTKSAVGQMSVSLAFVGIVGLVSTLVWWTCFL
jgi:hypothetical protein